ncbi:germination protein [Paenibacillus baekrokdamisoli]|uniref:Germination protein n=1 Tax=Paenibacillus baekrokdamisoli TaxID=1712516 RepID=A0A3G9JCU1_9BACL|nr:endospore germination permease [Paenibacillus baekrokdamisoli]MBB3068193.1 spore germination protein KB [Paenibacillus baekrokdamisoli]BBH22763.1 germination protein [Paenibacillus baekrokdamisoli]
MGRITQLQLYMLFSQFLFSTIIGFLISALVRNAGFMVWVSVILGSVCGCTITYLAYRLSLRRSTRSFGQYGHEILGKWIHYPLITLLICANMFTAAFILRQLVDFIVQNYLPKTPDWAVAAIFGLCIVQSVRSGPVMIFRSAQGLFFFSIISVLVFPLFTAREVNVDMAVAFVTNFDLGGTWNGILIITALFGEMGFIIYFFPYFVQPEKIMRSLVWAAFTAVIITLAVIITTILLFGPELTATLASPALELVRYIRAGAFLENLDPLLIVFWLFSIFLKISLFLLVSVLGLTHTLGLKDHKPFAYLMGMTMVCLSLFMFKSAAIVERITNYSETTILLITCTVPVLYLLVDIIRSPRKKEEQQVQQGQQGQTSIKGS